MHIRAIIGSVVSLVGLGMFFYLSKILGGALFVFGIIIFFNQEEDEIEQIKTSRKNKLVKSKSTKFKKKRR